MLDTAGHALLCDPGGDARMYSPHDRKPTNNKAIASRYPGAQHYGMGAFHHDHFRQ